MNFVCVARDLSHIARQIGDPWCRRYLLVTLLSRPAYPLAAAACVPMRGGFNALSAAGRMSMRLRSRWADIQADVKVLEGSRRCCRAMRASRDLHRNAHLYFD